MDVNGCMDPSSLRSVGMTKMANSGFPFKHYTFILAPHRFAELPLITNKGSSFELKNYTLNNKQHATYNIQHTTYSLHVYSYFTAVLMDVNGCMDPSSLRSVGMTKMANSGFPFKHYTFILAPHRFAELPLITNKGSSLFMFALNNLGGPTPPLHIKQLPITR